MAIVWPLSLAGVDARNAVAVAAIAIGLLVFVSGTVTWLVTRFEGRDVADEFVYRWSRHPQYAGWIVWSWGLMLVAAQQPVPMAGQNPGAALAWVVSSLVIVAVAWAEERSMAERAGPAWQAYRDRTPFLLPVPAVVGRLASLPIRLVCGRPQPESGRQILAAFLACLGVAIVLSIPFAVLAWPPAGWWAWPTFAPPVIEPPPIGPAPIGPPTAVPAPTT
jgi:protein-S-isoprenylcysteine O-methyltransferase Ste14